MLAWYRDLMKSSNKVSIKSSSLAILGDRFGVQENSLCACVAFVIVIVNSKFLKRHSKAKRRAPAYSRALHQIRGVFQRIVRGRLRSGFHMVKGCVKSEGFSKAQVRLPEGE